MSSFLKDSEVAHTGTAEALAAIYPIPSVNRIERVEVTVPIHQLFACFVCPGTVMEGVEPTDGETVQREGRGVDGNGQFSPGLGSEWRLRLLR